MNDFDPKQLPKHIAIIMDGNGRWAASRQLGRSQGHMEGMRRVEEIVDESQRLGIKCLTLFTFSTENWSRPAHEVTMLMGMLTQVLQKKLKKLVKNNIRFQMIGREERIPKPLLKSLHAVRDNTAENTGMVMNLAFNYGSRLEILDAVKDIARRVKNGGLDPEDINEDVFSSSLYTHNLMDPDLLIRTSGEQRISNFLLWQLSYAEFYFTSKFWPEFTIDEFHKALGDYQRRERRFGSLATKSN